MGLGATGAQGCLVNLRIQTDQHVPLLDGIAGFEGDFLDYTGHLVGDTNTVNRFHAADGLELRCPLLRDDGGRTDLCRRLWLGHLLFHLAELEELVAENASEHRAQ